MFNSCSNIVSLNRSNENFFEKKIGDIKTIKGVIKCIISEYKNDKTFKNNRLIKNLTSLYKTKNLNCYQLLSRIKSACDQYQNKTGKDIKDAILLKIHNLKTKEIINKLNQLKMIEYAVNNKQINKNILTFIGNEPNYNQDYWDTLKYLANDFNTYEQKTKDIAFLANQTAIVKLTQTKIKKINSLLGKKDQISNTTKTSNKKDKTIYTYKLKITEDSTINIELNFDKVKFSGNKNEIVTIATDPNYSVNK